MDKITLFILNNVAVALQSVNITKEMQHLTASFQI